MARPCIGVVSTDLDRMVGGVAAVADFVCGTIERSARFDLAVVSLPLSSGEPLGVGLMRPASWFKGVRTAKGVWRGRPFVSVGAAGSELEFQRYRPRPALARALARCDLVQVVAGLPAPACAVYGLGKPVALHCATRAVIDREARHRTVGGAAEMCRRVMTRIVDRVDRAALEGADAIQAMNPGLLDYARLVNVGRDKSIRLVPPGVDTSRFVPRGDRDCRRDPYVLSVLSRLDDARKNVGLLLRAFAAAAERTDGPLRLVLAGFAGPDAAFWRDVDRHRLRSRVTVVHAADADALIALYQGAAAFALSSDEEGFGMVLVEAMACGVPVVSTSSAGPASILRDGVDGYLVPVGDAAMLGERLARLVSDEALNRRMGAEARRAAVEAYDISHTGERLLETYDLLLGAPRRDRMQ